MNKIVTTGVIAFALLAHTNVLAQEQVAPIKADKAEFKAGIENRKAEIEAKRKEIEAKREETRKLVEQKKEGLKNERKEIKESYVNGSTTRAEMKEKREDMRENASSTRKEIKELRDDRKEFASSTRGEIKKKRAETKEEVKAQIGRNAEKIAAKFNNDLAKFNKKKTLFSDKSATLKANGVDTTVIDQKINDLTTTIATAQSAIDAVKAFTPDVTKEKNVNVKAFEALVTSARESLKAVHKGLSDIVPLLRSGMATSTAATTN